MGWRFKIAPHERIFVNIMKNEKSLINQHSNERTLFSPVMMLI
jgi:hypothetical protein